MQFQKCSKCGESKPLDNDHFYTRKDCTTGFARKCIECERAYRREYDRRSKDKTKGRYKRAGQLKATRKNANNLYCAKGDLVEHKGKTVYVTEVLETGRLAGTYVDGSTFPARKAFVSGCLFDEQTRQPLFRTSVHPGNDWKHISA